MQFNSSWTPDLPPPALFSERTYLAGVFIHCMAYGAVATLSLQCLALLRSTAVGSPRSRRLWSAVVAFLLACSTIYAAIGVTFVSLAFINNRDYPGGPVAFIHHFFSVPFNAAGAAFFTFGSWTCDAILLWRYTVMYRDCRVPILRWIMLFIPCAAYLTFIAIGIMFIVQTASPAGSPWESSTINATPVYYLLSLTFNISLSLAIVLRLLHFRRKSNILRLHLGSDAGVQYVSIAAMLTESAMLFTAVSIFIIVPTILKHPIQYIFGLGFVHFQIISSLLIIFRVASGKAYSESTIIGTMSTFRASPPRRIAMDNLQRNNSFIGKGSRRADEFDQIEVHIEREKVDSQPDRGMI